MKERTAMALGIGLALMLLLAAGACRKTGDDEEEQAFYRFFLDTPPDGATDVNPMVLLHWSISCNMDWSGDADLYFGVTPYPPFLRKVTRGESGYHRPGPLKPNQTYYWRLYVPSPPGSSKAQSFTVGRDRTLWAYALPPGQSVYDTQPVPLVLGNRIYQTSEKNLLYCLDAATGALFWIFDPSQATSMAKARPAAAERVYHSTGKIWCLDALTGAVQWRSVSPAATGYRPPLARGDRLFAHSNDRISCFDAATGSEIWGTDRVLCTSLAEAGGRVFVTTTTSVYGDGTTFLECLDAETGSRLWSRDFGTRFPPPRNPAAAASRVYVSCAASLYCMDAASGATIWEFAARERAGKPFVFADQVLLSEGQDSYVLLDAGSGVPLWRTTLINSAYQHYTSMNGDPVVVGGNLMLADWSGYLYAIDAATGEIRWHYFVSTDMQGIASFGNRVYVTGDDEYLYCLDTEQP
jgi:outer membrane protein assembly factor BamB